MELAIHYPDFGRHGTDPAAIAPELAATARAADEGGASTFTLMDHYFQMASLGGAEHPMLEGYTGLGFVAGVTQRIRLGLLVTGVTYRHPGLLAKIGATVDVLSGGRSVFGIGAAWYEREHHGLGVPYPPLGERFERLEEALRICLQMWSDDDGPFAGKHYGLAETICEPRPVQRPHPPLMIGGGGERKTLRLVAQYADACNLFAMDPGALPHKLEVLARHCEDVGRDPAEIQKTVIGGGDPVGDPDGFLRSMEPLARLGIAQVWVSPSGPDRAAWVTTACERVLPRLSEL